MTLRLSLVIEGDGSGARRALEDAARGVEELGRKSEETGRKLEETSRKVESAGKIEWNTAEFDRARNGLQGAADEAERAATGVASVGDAGASAAPEIVKVGEAADGARGKLSGLGGLIIGAAGGLAAGIAINAIGEGLRAAAQGAADLYREVTSNQPAIERALTSHAELIGRIKGAYAEAAGAASSYGLNSTALLRFESQQNVQRVQGAFDASVSDLEGRGAFAPIMPDQAGGRDRLGPLREEVSAFRRELKDGEADVIAFRQRVAEIAEALPADSPFRGLAEAIFEDTQAAAELQAELQRSRDLLQGLSGDADAAAAALGGKAEKYETLTGSAAGAGEAVSGSAAEIRGAGEAASAAIPALAEFDALMRSIAGGGSLPDLGNASRGALQLPTSGRGFAAGGYTGDGAWDEPAGIVHAGEFVVKASQTARHRGLLEAINSGMPGYASGGFVNPVLPMAGGATGTVAAVAGEFRMLQGTLHQFGSALLRAGSASEALQSVFNMVTQRLVDNALRMLDQLVFGGGPAGGIGGGGGLFGSIFSGLFGGASYFPPAPVGLYHSGGRVGAFPASSRAVPAAVFAGAPRMHSGGWLKPGERPVIAKDGEEIGWPAQLAGKYGSNVEVVINNAPAGTRVREETGSIDGRQLRRVVVDIVNEAEADGSFDQARRSRYGMAPLRMPR